jgi:hypothetical protein
VVVETLLEWMEPERVAYDIENEKEQEIYLREHAMKVRQQEWERQQRISEEQRAVAETEEFTKVIQSEIQAGLKEQNLPTDQGALWTRVGEKLTDFRSELPSFIQEDVAATRRELIKQARTAVKQVAEERTAAIQATLPDTLSDDELAKRNPNYAKFLKQQRVDKAKKKRSTKKKGNVEKAKKKKEEQKKATRPSRKFISTEELFREID